MVSHQARPTVNRLRPLHITLRVAAGVWNLRSRRSFSVIRRALSRCEAADGLRIIDFSVQGNHLHLIVEADDNRALSRGMQGLSLRLAKGLNRMMGRRGRVLADRYHARVLRTPTEIRHALHYVRDNHDHHRQRWGAAPWRMADPFSSSARDHGVALGVARGFLLRRERAVVLRR